MKIKALAAIVASIGAVSTAQAALLVDPNAITNWSVIDFNNFSPAVVVPTVTGAGLNLNQDVRMTSTTYSEVGEIASYNLGANGIWSSYIDPNIPMNGFIGSGFQDDEQTPTAGTITFRFRDQTTLLNKPVAAVGALINSFQMTDGVLNNTIVISANNAAGNTIEQYVVSPETFAGGYNEGIFYGIVRPTADIYSFTVSDGAVVIDDFRYATAPVPEPTEYALLLAGLGLVGFMVRRRKQIA
jgi:PEP-CTERM motif